MRDEFVGRTELRDELMQFTAGAGKLQNDGAGGPGMAAASSPMPVGDFEREMDAETAPAADSPMLAIFGKPGIGKTALFARHVADVEENAQDGDVRVLKFFTGVGPLATSAMGGILQLCYQAKALLGAEIDIPNDLHQARVLLVSLLRDACFLSPVVVVFDALDLLADDDQGEVISLFEACARPYLPSNLRFIVSTGGMVHSARLRLRRLFPAFRTITIGPLQSLEMEEIMARQLAQFNIRIEAIDREGDLMKTIVERNTSGSPLWLNIVAQHVRIWKQEGRLGTIKGEVMQLPQSVRDMYEDAFGYLEA